ncbi:MAG: hypothetical protein P8100_10710 [bacterium]
MRKSVLLIVFAIIGSIIISTSCNSGEKGKLKGFKKDESGLYYKQHVKGDGEVSPVEGDYLDMIMIYGTEDSVIFDSRTLPLKGTRASIPMTKPLFKGDIYDGLGMMVEGDSMTFALVADSVWIKLFRMPSVPPGFDSVEYLYFDIKLNEIISAGEMQRRKDEEARVALEKGKC